MTSPAAIAALIALAGVIAGSAYIHGRREARVAFIAECAATCAQACRKQ
jgi:hypothetical protein